MPGQGAEPPLSVRIPLPVARARFPESSHVHWSQARTWQQDSRERRFPGPHDGISGSSMSVLRWDLRIFKNRHPIPAVSTMPHTDRVMASAHHETYAWGDYLHG